MNIDPEALQMLVVFFGVNAGLILLMAVMSYVLAAVLLNGVAALDRRLDSSRKRRG